MVKRFFGLRLVSRAVRCDKSRNTNMQKQGSMVHAIGDIAGSGDHWVRAEMVFDGERLLHDKHVRISDGLVVGIASAGDVPDQAEISGSVHCLSPGFFDIQVNGGSGRLINSSPDVHAVRQVAAAHRGLGTTAILPTVITDAPQVLEQVCEAVVACHGSGGVMGIHIEGPHISVARRGTHAVEFIRPLDGRTMGCVERLRGREIPVLITLAPEAVAPGQISELVKLGAVVSIGHSDCDAAGVQAALAEGATLFTHLFNAMSQMQGRSPGVAGTAINSAAYCSVICDGVHVDDQMVGLAVRARPVPDRMILISDAMPTVGGPDSFELYGQTIRLEQGRLVNDQGALAGAHTTMAASVARIVSVVGVSLQDALCMAVSNPARLMGVSDRFSLVGMDVADLVVLDEQLECTRLTP